MKKRIIKNIEMWYEKEQKIIMKMIKNIKRASKKKKKKKKKIQRIIWRIKNIKREYGANRYFDISKEKKQKLKEYQKNYREAKKSQFSGQ